MRRRMPYRIIAVACKQRRCRDEQWGRGPYVGDAVFLGETCDGNTVSPITIYTRFLAFGTDI